MASDHKVIDRMIARLREMPHLAERVAPEVADAVREQFAEQVARGQTPAGAPWKLTRDGRVPLRNAARAIEVRAIGTVIVARLEGHHARHHLGAVKGKIRRRILPSSRITPPVARAIEKVVTRAFRDGGRP